MWLPMQVALQKFAETAGALPSTGVDLAEFLVFTPGTRLRLFSLFMFSRTHGTLEVKLL